MLLILSKFKGIDFKFAWNYKQNLETIYYTRFFDLNKFKVSLLQGKGTKVEGINFAEC